jgi:hypothetical protein
MSAIRIAAATRTSVLAALIGISALGFTATAAADPVARTGSDDVIVLSDYDEPIVLDDYDQLMGLAVDEPIVLDDSDQLMRFSEEPQPEPLGVPLSRR